MLIQKTETGDNLIGGALCVSAVGTVPITNIYRVFSNTIVQVWGASLYQPVGHWEFADSEDLTKATIGNDLILEGTQTALAEGVNIGVGSYYTMEHNIPTVGEETKVNKYTIVMDIRVAELNKWYSLYQTNLANDEDAEVFIKENGTIGISSAGYSDTAITANQWQKVAIAVDNGSQFKIYLDGELILDGTPQDVDGRWGLESTILIFADNNGEDESIDIRDLKIYDKALTYEEINGIAPTTNSFVIDTTGWANTEIDVVDLKTTFEAVTTDTVITLNDGEINSPLTMTNTNSCKILIKAKNLLGVALNSKIILEKDTNDTYFEGFLCEHHDSKIQSYGARTKIIRSRFDGSNGGGQDQWIRIQCPADGDINQHGIDAEVAYCEFLNYHAEEEGANSTIFMWTYLGQTHVSNHNIHHCLFKNYSAVESNGFEPISWYTSSAGGEWNAKKTENEIVHNGKIHDLVFINCTSDDELIKGGITGTEFKNIAIIGCRGALSFRFGRNQSMENIFIDGENVSNSICASIKTANCILKNVVAVNLDNADDAISVVREVDIAEGGHNFTIDNVYVQGGKNTLRVCDYYEDTDLRTDFEGTIRNSTFVAHDNAVGIFGIGDDVQSSMLTVENTEYYGSPRGADIGATELGSEPAVPDHSWAITEAQVGINA